MLPGFDNNLDRANELAERAVALDGTSAFALARLGFIQAWLHRCDIAIANLEKAVDLAPNDAEVYATFGQVLNFWGDPERALVMLKKAFSLDTLAPPVWEHQVGHSHLLLRQYGEAIASLHRAIERAPEFPPSYAHLACAYVELDRFNDARETIKTVLEVIPKFNHKNVARIFSAYRIDEDRDRFLDAIRTAGLPAG